MLNVINNIKNRNIFRRKPASDLQEIFQGHGIVIT